MFTKRKKKIDLLGNHVTEARRPFIGVGFWSSRRWHWSSTPVNPNFGRLLKSTPDYSEFPAIAYCIQKWGVFPSTYMRNYIVVYKDLIAALDAQKNQFYFYIENISNKIFEADDFNGKSEVDEICFICFECKYTKVLFYITLTSEFHTPDAVKMFIENGRIHTRAQIQCLYHPEITREEIIGIRNKIIHIPNIDPSSSTSKINILYKHTYGYGLDEHEIPCPEIDFNTNYNSDFTDIHKLIQEKLSMNNEKGLILLHGMPGTGKTTYIRYLINHIKKKVIYIPPNMVSCLSDPELIKFLMDKRNSVLVIEEAEGVLTKRDSGGGQAVANLLNLSDGLLSDIAKMQIIVTFNTDLLNIDAALLRKGRLIAKYEFKELESERAQKLADKLGVSINVEHTLAEIYNKEEASFAPKKAKIGY